MRQRFNDDRLLKWVLFGLAMLMKVGGFLENIEKNNLSIKDVISIFLKMAIIYLFFVTATNFSDALAETNPGSQPAITTSSESINDVLVGIHEVAQHGNLMDILFFEKKMHIKMNQLPDKYALFGFEICGIPEDPALNENSPAKLRRYQYVEVPWSLKEPIEHPNFCSADYIERLDNRNKISKSMVKLEFDINRSCTSEEMFLENFKDARRDSRSTENAIAYYYNGNNGLRINFLFYRKKTSPACIEAAVLTQTF